MIRVEILSRSTIKPSTPTPQSLRNFKISYLDQTAISSFIPILYYYDSKISPSNVSKTFENLKTSFAETLTVYYPLAGRLLQNLSAIDCNDEGALYIEAKTEISLSQFLENPDMASLNKFLPCMGNCVERDCDALTAVQITKFQCGGLVIGACMLHKVVDTSAMSGFMKNWAKIACGLKDQVDYPDLYSPSQYFPPMDSFDPDFLTGLNRFLFGPPKNNITKRYVFDANALATLQTQASSENAPRPSRIVALTAFICNRMIAGRGVEKSESQRLFITHPVNMRRRIEPPLPENSFGNLLWLAYGICETPNGEMESLPDLVQVVNEMFININNETIKELSSELVLAAITKAFGDLEAIENMQTLKFTSWCNIASYDINFGWGEPVWISHMGDAFGLRSTQQFTFLDTKCGKGIEVWMAFDKQTISTLENDLEFLKYATLNPSIYIS